MDQVFLEFHDDKNINFPILGGEGGCVFAVS